MLAKGKPKKRKTLKEKTARELVREADKWWSKYIRLRDSKRQVDGSWVGSCIDCGKQIIVYNQGWKSSSNNGHFITRGIHGLRFHPKNTNLQSAYCNAWKDKDEMTRGYAQGLDDWYGPGTAAELRRLAKEPGAYAIPPKATLLQLITDCKAYVEKTLKETENG